MKVTKSLLIFLSITLLFACDKDEAPIVIDIPETYNFENVSYGGQLTRLAMFSEMKIYMNTANVVGGAELDEAKLLAMYSNDADNAGWSQTYDAGKQMKSKTFEPVQADFEALLTRLAAASKSTVLGEPGVAGVIESNDGAKAYLIDENGLDLPQIFEKSLMGALLYYQATSVYMGTDRMNVDNEEITQGSGTKMEHHWDEAFGYLGVPIDFPLTTSGLFFWGDYANKREAVLGNSQRLMDAMLKGRAAISQKQLDKRDEAIEEARAEWELISVASALHYLNSGIENFDDKALALHGLSEVIGFIYSLQFNEGKKITNAQVSELLTLVAGSADFSEMNLYNTTVENLQSAKDKLSDYYNLDDKKDQF